MNLPAPLHEWTQLITSGDTRILSRTISLVENEAPGYEALLSSFPQNDHTRIIGITGPPGAGKSTLTDALVEELLKEGKRVAILCVDPSSPFSKGAILGDRIRMGRWYNEPMVYIRSLATRGWLGGLHPHAIEITELLKFAGFDYILVETVGVGQSEIDIAGLADLTLVVVVPEAGDDIQTMKAGLMEIADVFVINKSDRPGADIFLKNLELQLYPSRKQEHKRIPVLKTVANQHTGIAELCAQINKLFDGSAIKEERAALMAEKAWQLLQQKRMKGMNIAEMKKEIETLLLQKTFNLYQYVADK